MKKGRGAGKTFSVSYKFGNDYSLQRIKKRVSFVGAGHITTMNRQLLALYFLLFIRKAIFVMFAYKGKLLKVYTAHFAAPLLEKLGRNILIVNMQS
jgi:hypothetical protein